ncbi:MAG: filamentous hemagglutinin N-terminal domain-containing protein, partial [Candidatus Tectomicrobia bacterium]|nr:filamentous hemagglutinin N-terminal domain-containing protein [Candidatus Tectomicrobia bacterium]
MRHSRYYWRLTNPAFLIVALLILSLVVWFEVSTAQVTTNITSDGTLGTEVTQAGNVHEITGGTRPGDGPNLFHSFGHFDVGTGDTAHFMGQPGIEHIIGRVTGGDASMIDGTLQSDASLFLLNPQGFMFGANATLNINGSFHVSTADVLRFADGAEFSTHLSEKSALTVAAPTAFGFLNENPAGIAIEGSTLAVPDGETVSIVGGDIAIRGGLLSAPSGQLHMTSVASAGDVISHPADQPSGLTVDTVERLGRIEITQETRLDVSGDGGGTISLRGGRLWIDSSTIAADTTGARNGAGIGIDIDVAEDVFVINGGVITTNALGAGKAGDIRIRSSNTEMSNSSFVSSQVAPDAVGDSGNITVEVESLKLEDGAQIFTNTLGAGQGGTVRVTATGAVMLSGTSRDGTFPSGIVTATQGRGTETGTAGAVVLKAAEVSATGGAQIFSITTGAGQGGTVTVIADTVTFGSSVLTPEAVFLSGLFANTFGSGHAGDVLVEAATVTLTEGAQIGSITFGPGHAGAVTVRATDAVILDGTVAAPDGRIFPSGIFAQTQGANEMAGNAGTVLVEATNLTLTGTAQISTSTNGPGSAGTLTIIAHESIDIVDQGGGPFRSGLFSNSGEGDEIAGNAGDIVIMAPRLTVDGGRILARTLGDGDAGNTVIQVERLELLRGGQLFNGIGNAQANGEILGNPNGTGRGGNLMVMATDSIVIDGQDIAGFFSSIGSNAQIGNGDAGNIFVSAPRLEMRKGGFISTGTSSGSRGNAGDLRVEVEWLMLTEGGQIS